VCSKWESILNLQGVALITAEVRADVRLSAMAATGNARYKFGLFEANLDSGELFRNGQKLRLQEQPFQVLVVLLERSGELVTREELRQRIWATDTFVDFDHSLNTAVNKLRDTLGDGAANPRFIETLPRRGYRFIAPVQSVPTETVNESPDQPESTSPISPNKTDDESELPQAHPTTARVLFGILQTMYLVIYAVALWRLEEIVWRASYVGLSGTAVLVLVLVTGVVGVALRLYTLNATLFNYRHLGRNFQRLFPFVLVLDVVWATSPFLLTHLIGIGLAFAGCAALVYSPFAQRVLALMAYPPER
jgi:DNA-binding winged helix-turn-helix (wHTH) protein